MTDHPKLAALWEAEFVRYLLDNPDVYLVRGRWVRVPKSWLPTPQPEEPA